MRKVSWACWVGALAGLAGCMTVGPTAVRVGRSKYNDAIQQTDKQQMLQNIVRLRYKDFPYFLEVSSVLSAPAFEASADGSATFGTSTLTESAAACATRRRRSSSMGR